MVVAPLVRANYIVIDTERCKGCGLCIHTCPRNVIGLASHMNQAGYFPAEVIPEKSPECTGCTACAMMCPDAAISVYRREKVLSH